MLNWNRKSVLFVGVFEHGSTNVSQANSFEEMGCDVTRFDYRNGYSSITDSSLRRLCFTIERAKPEVVFFSKCNGVPVEVVHLANKTGKTVMWYMDPLNKNFDAEVKQKIESCTISCFALQKPLEAAQAFSDTVYFVHEGFDPKIDQPHDIVQDLDVTFIGDLRDHRAVYARAVGFANVTGAYGRDHAEAVSRSKINLNFTEGGASDRVYKVLAAGGFLLTQPWPDMEKDFLIGRDLDVFTTPTELKEKIRYYLTDGIEEREGIALYGNQTVQRFSRSHFGPKILALLEHQERNK